MDGAAEVMEYVSKSVAGYSFHADTVFVSWIVIGIFAVLALILRKQIAVIPGRLQMVIEYIIVFFEELADGMGTGKAKKYISLVICFFLFIATANLIGLIPNCLHLGWLKFSTPPTRDINTTVALALFSFFTFQYVGYKEKGIKHILHYFHPVPELAKDLPKAFWILLPVLLVLFTVINIIEELARVLSLSVRLMGNVMGEHLVVAVFLGLVASTFVSAFSSGWFGVVWGGLGLAMDLLPMFMNFLGLFMGVIQAFVFSILTLSYISSAME